jgi:hypothetical protein
MSLIIFTKFLISLLVGMLALPVGILPSIFLFRDLANGTDASENAKARYAWTLWGGMVLAWIIGTFIVWWVLGMVWV